MSKGTMSKRMPAFVVTAALCIPAALLGLLLLSWRLSVSSSHEPYYSPQTNGPGNVSKLRGSAFQGAPSAGLSVANQQASIVILVTSKESSRDRRSWQRTQFQRNVALLRKQDPAAADGVVMRFTIGKTGLSEQGLRQVQAEQQEHGDILLLDIMDSNSPDPPPNDSDETATSLKVVYGVNWAVKHYDFPWLVRLGDDSYFRVDHFLLNASRTLDKDQLVLGFQVPGDGVQFSNGATIKGYCSGMGFVMTHDVAQFISNNAPYLHKGYPEDAVVGMWLAATNFRVQHDTRFHDWDWKQCSDDSILIHKHNYGAVDADGVMRSCFPAAQT